MPLTLADIVIVDTQLRDHVSCLLVLYTLLVCSLSHLPSASCCLSSTRRTRFHEVTVDENLLGLIYEPREVTI